MGIKDIYAKIIERKGTNAKNSSAKNKKYYLSTEEEDTFHIINAEGQHVSLHRIVAKKDLIGGVSGRSVFVKKGDKGGFVQSEENLSSTGLCWVYDDAIVHGRAKILDDAKVRGGAVVRDSAIIRDNATVSSKATVAGEVVVCDSARVGGQAKVIDNAVIKGFSQVKGTAMVCDNSTICDFAQVCNNSIVAGQANVCGTTIICSSNQKQSPASIVFNNATIDSAFVYESAIFGNAHIQGQYGVRGQTVTRENQLDVAQKYDVSLYKCKVGDNSVIQNNCNIEESQPGAVDFDYNFSQSPLGIKITRSQIKDDVQVVLDSPNKIIVADCCVEGGVKLDTSDNIELYAKTLTDQPFDVEEDAAQ